VIGLFLDDVYVFSHVDEPKPIGTAVRSMMFSGGDTEAATAVYDRYLKEYRLIIPPTTRDGTSVVWRFSITTGQWTFDEFPFDVGDMASEFYTVDPIIDYMEEVIDTVDIAIDDMVGILNTSGLFLSQYGTSGKVVGQLLDGNTHDIEQGTLIANQQIFCIMELGVITSGTAFRRTNLIEAQVEHDTAGPLGLYMDYSEDRGTTWMTYDYWDLTAASVPTIVRFAKYLEAKMLTVRLTCLNAAGLVLNSWILRTNTGSKNAH